LPNLLDNIARIGAMTYPIGQTAVIVPVPAMESLVAPWRSRFDVSAGFGVPAHVTVLYPFLPLDRIDPGVTHSLQEIFAAESAFDVTFAGFGEFPSEPAHPGPLYLDPQPAGPFRRLTSALGTRWPEAPPYGGAHADPIPHLTVTEIALADEKEAARAAIEPGLPVTTVIGTGSLLVFDGSRWVEEALLPLTPR
jgi:2'-5' RNA ligase